MLLFYQELIDSRGEQNYISTNNSNFVINVGDNMMPNSNYYCHTAVWRQVELFFGTNTKCVGENSQMSGQILTIKANALGNI